MNSATMRGDCQNATCGMMPRSKPVYAMTTKAATHASAETIRQSAALGPMRVSQNAERTAPAAMQRPRA